MEHDAIAPGFAVVCASAVSGKSGTRGRWYCTAGAATAVRRYSADDATCVLWSSALVCGAVVEDDKGASANRGAGGGGGGGSRLYCSAAALGRAGCCAVLCCVLCMVDGCACLRALFFPPFVVEFDLCSIHSGPHNTLSEPLRQTKLLNARCKMYVAQLNVAIIREIRQLQAGRSTAKICCSMSDTQSHLTPLHYGQVSCTI